MKNLIRIFIAWRLLLFIVIYFVFFLFPYRDDYAYTNIWKFTPLYFPASSPLLFPWANFDGVHYLSIAASGYSNDLGFFPLFPVLIKLWSMLLGAKNPFDLGFILSGLIIANACFITALVFFRKLIKLDFPEKIATESMLYLLLFPTSFFFAAIYTESIFLLLTVLSFYFARGKKWGRASIFAILLSSSRVVGIAILPALLYEFYIEEKTFFSKKIIPILLTPFGLLSYVFYNYFQFGDPFLFIKAHENINPTRSVDHPILFPQTLFRYLKIITTTYGNYEWWIALLELASFLIACAFLFIAWKKKVRISYLIFSVFAFLVPISSGTFSGLPRYILILFPMFIGLALTKNKVAKIIYIGVSLIILVLLLTAFSKGYFVA